MGGFVGLKLAIEISTACGHCTLFMGFQTFSLISRHYSSLPMSLFGSHKSHGKQQQNPTIDSSALCWTGEEHGRRNMPGLILYKLER